MANTSALLANLLGINADINYYTQQSIYWNSKYEANSAKLSKQVKYEENWEKEYDKAMDETRTSDLRMNGNVFIAKETAAASEAEAEAWADYKVEEFDRELSLELADLDLEYDTMKTMYDTLLEEMRAQQESAKGATSNAASDTCRLD